MPATSAAGDADKGTAAATASPFTAPQLSLPEGGGALRGIDEKFTSQAARGTGSLSVPIPTSSGRLGFGPQLAITYDSGAGNGPFGVGWSLSLPAITRRTDKGMPHYEDAVESDVFVLSGYEDLVPQLIEDGAGGWREEVRERHGHRVKAYRPRTEGLFARIERWTSLADGMTHWRSISRDNVLTVYGLDAGSRIADPEDPTHVFTWLICRSYDGKGNAIVYDYVGEDERGVFLDRPSERHRSRSANRYLKRVRYGNREPLLVDASRPGFRRCHVEAHGLDRARWMFSVVFDYGEHHYTEEAPDPEGRVLGRAHYRSEHPWPARLDPFSSYRSGFEIRTYRLCQRVLMFHHIPEELGAEDCLVTSTAFDYRQKRFASFLERVIQWGHVLQADDRYLSRSLPPLELGYTRSPLEDVHFDGFAIRDVDPESLANLPGGVDGGAYRWVDLDGEGIAGVLANQGGAWLYKPNLGNGRLGQIETVRERPTLADLSQKTHHLMDVSGSGCVNLVDLSVSSPGFYERTQTARWQGFRAFRSTPVLDWSDPNLRFVDLTGDGIADVLITEDDAFTWHASLLEEGFAAGVRVHIPIEEEESGPRAIFSDPTQSVFLADMTGDGLTDLVRIRNGEVVYWPNRGFGRFGAKVTLDHSPWFEESDQFEQRRIRLADTDGSGTTDILYLARDGVKIYLNESGNSLSPARKIGSFPVTDNVTAVDVADVLGRGTACLIWSSPLPRECGRQLRYIDLMCGQKPHLLSQIDNNMGSSTRIEYVSSTEFYLADKAAGAPWVTRLPFPIHVVRRVEIYDTVSRNRIITRYTYHHGFYDALEREFRGFARVDQLDTEDIASLGEGRLPQGDNWDEASTLPPVLTKTWFHTGVFLQSGQISRHLAREYFEPGTSGAAHATASLADTLLPEHLSPFEAREACRSLKGSILRQETYALDGSARERLPYVVSESNFTVVPLQPKGDNRYAVFFTHPCEAISLQYERRPEDPRISHELTLDVDQYGNVLRSASIAYRRLRSELAEQQQTLATLTETRYTNRVDQPDAYRLPLPAQSSSFQLTGPAVKDASRLGFTAVRKLTAQAECIPYEIEPSATITQKRRVSCTRVAYRRNDLSALLPCGELESLALPGESYQLAFTPGLLGVFEAKASTEDLMAILGSEAAAYRDLDGDLWVPSGRVFYAPDHDINPTAELQTALRDFFLPRRYRNPFGHDTTVAYDEHRLFPLRTRDALGNERRAELDYRVLHVKELTDPNGNRAAVRYDALGMIAGTVIRGKADGPVEGDSFEEFVTDLSAEEIGRYRDAEDPRELARILLGTATTRVINDFTRVPACTATVARETHVSDLARGCQTRVQLRFAYWDGFGRQAQIRLQAEPGPLNLHDAAAPIANPRWVASGAQVYNNKGNPVRQFEPFFSRSPRFGIERWGVSSILLYDPLQRVVATLRPNRTHEKVAFDAWTQQSYDANDTVTSDPAMDADVGALVRRLPRSDYSPTWYERRIAGEEGPQERAAAEQAALHANTPSRELLDPLGRTFLKIADNGTDADGVRQLYATRTVLSIEGYERVIIDPLGRQVMRYDYNMAGARIHQQSMEAGERWILHNAARNPLIAWNSRNYRFRIEYDALQRKVRSFVQGGMDGEEGAQCFPREIEFERTLYGDSADTGIPEAERRRRNLRATVYCQFDSAGVFLTDAYDFKGNTLDSTRQFARNYTEPPDWTAEVVLEDEKYSRAIAYDALNRQVEVTQPDGSLYRTVFNEAGLLQALNVNVRAKRKGGERVWSPFVRFVNYDPKGQRTLIRYGNGASTAYEYDELTFQLRRLMTVRGRCAERATAQIFKSATIVQDLRYIFDPVGNIVRIDDAALERVFHANRRVDPVAQYTFDPLYRLTASSGRELIGQAALQFVPPGANYRDYPFAGATSHSDPQALRGYLERYRYDAVGNVLLMAHDAEGGSWQRHYEYQERSSIEAELTSNRLTRTWLQESGRRLSESYLYDANGNVTRMPHLPRMFWNFNDELRASSRQVADMPETTYYVYDAAGQRARKVTQRRDGEVSEQRLYLGAFEVFRRFGSHRHVTLERQTLHVMDDAQRVALVETLTCDNGEILDSPVPTQRFQLRNHLGSAAVELDDNGALLTYEEYSAYGNSTYQAGATAAEISSKRYRYTGKERDEENGFTYHGARYYAPWLARWTAADSVFKSDFSNAYEYVRSNPVVLQDPTGQEWTRFWGGVRAVGGAAQFVGGAVFAVATAETVAGAVLGVGVAMHGLSDYEAGLRQMRTGQEARSVTEVGISAGLQGLGVEKENADSAGKAADITLGFVNPTGPITGGPRAALALASGGQRVMATAVHVAPAAVSVAAHTGYGAHVMMAAHNGNGDSGGGGSSSGSSESSAGGTPEQPKGGAPDNPQPGGQESAAPPAEGPASQPAAGEGNAATGAASTPPPRVLGPGETYVPSYTEGDKGMIAALNKDGMLELVIEKGPKTPSGSEMFQDAMRMFGPNVKGVRGVWLGGGTLKDNFVTYKALIQAGKTPEEAAMGTFTGKMAIRAGFTKVKVTADEALRVIVEFTR